MGFLLRGALIEYGVNLLGPIPNVVIFQFNPENLSRTIQIPERPTGSGSRETHQAGEVPLEKISLTAKFDASDQLGENNIIARAVGLGPQLAALEKMVRPSGGNVGLLGMAVDAIGDAIFGGDETETQPIPRKTYPRVLFLWGLTRVLPVVIDSMRIEEKSFDFLLNPIRAEVTVGLTVISPDNCADDVVAQGALEYSTIAKDNMAEANLANTVSQIIDLIPF